MIKKALAAIYGDHAQFPMEHRILNFIIALFVFISFFFFVFSIVQQLGLFFILFILGIILFNLFLFFLSRIKKLYHIPLWIIILFVMILFAVFFISRGGAIKGVLYSALLIALIIAILFRKASRIILLIILVLEITILLAIEYLYPHFIYKDNRINEILTISASIFIVILAASVLVIVLSKNYDYEKNCVEKANVKLNQLNNLKNDFIANITHDFRTPLTIVLNLAELEVMKRNGEDKEIYNAIYLGSLKLKNSIDKLLELAKMDVQGLKLRIQKLDITDFLMKIYDFYSSTLHGSSIEIQASFSKDPVDNLYTDPDKLEDILNNIISNSIKFVNPEKGNILMETLVSEKSVIIKITDNGIGIPRDKLEVIFDRFEQVDGSHKHPNRGTGIGLAFAKDLAGYLKARIWAESEGEGKGSSFFVELPRGKSVFKEQEIQDYSPVLSFHSNYERKVIKKLVQSDILEKQEKKEIIPLIKELNRELEFDVSKALILIIDDDRIFRNIIAGYLNDAGYRNYVMAYDGKSGLDAIYQYTPDLIICDYNMPVLSGGELHKEIAFSPGFKEIPFIFVSAITSENIIFESKKRGAVAYLSKPIDKRELLITVELHLKKYFDYLKQIKQASIDPLTGLKNRRIILDHLERELDLRKLNDLSVIFFDIDHFKYINDKYGHLRGDMVLEKIGNILKSKLRNYDISGRYGGDEFLIILPDTTLESAKVVAEHLRSEIESAHISWGEKKIRFTCSFGIASLQRNEEELCKAIGISSFRELYNIKEPEKTDWEKIEEKKKALVNLLFDIADRVLYKAKQSSCKDCGFSSMDEKVFSSGKCPECGKTNIVKGRNRFKAS